jgi:hypothetical protein
VSSGVTRAGDAPAADELVTAERIEPVPVVLTVASDDDEIPVQAMGCGDAVTVSTVGTGTGTSGTCTISTFVAVLAVFAAFAGFAGLAAAVVALALVSAIVEVDPLAPSDVAARASVRPTTLAVVAAIMGDMYGMIRWWGVLVLYTRPRLESDVGEIGEMDYA